MLFSPLKCHGFSKQHILPSFLVVSSLRSFSHPVMVMSMFLLSFIFVIVCGLFEWKWRFFFIVCLYAYCRWRSSCREGSVVIILTDLNQPHICACPKPGPGFPTLYVMDLLCSVSLVKMRDGCSFCCYRWSRSLFKLSFHKMVCYIKKGLWIH